MKLLLPLREMSFAFNPDRYASAFFVIFMANIENHKN